MLEGLHGALGAAPESAVDAALQIAQPAQIALEVANLAIARRAALTPEHQIRLAIGELRHRDREMECLAGA